MSNFAKCHTFSDMDVTRTQASQHPGPWLLSLHTWPLFKIIIAIAHFKNCCIPLCWGILGILSIHAGF